MRSKVELFKTTPDELVDWMVEYLKTIKNGKKLSTEDMLKMYFYGENYYKINPDDIYIRLIMKARENQILLDASSLYSPQSTYSYKDTFVVWKKKKYISHDTFRELCEEYDGLFDSLNSDDADYNGKRSEILSGWKEDCKIFKRNPELPPKTKKAVRIKDLDKTPFEPPVKEDVPFKNINVIPIGSGSDGNSFYIEIGSYKILVDAGVPLKRVNTALLKNGRETTDIDAVFITHGHADHISGIKAISNAVNCPVYTSKFTKRDLEELGVESNILEPYKKTEVLTGFTVNMFEADHDYPITYGFVFETENCKVSLLTDNGYINSKRLKQMYGSDVAILEANFDLDILEKNFPNDVSWRVSMNHSSNIRCGYSILALHDYGTRNFLLAHLSKHNNKPEVALDTVRTMLRSRYANIHICKTESDELLSY